MTDFNDSTEYNNFHQTFLRIQSLQIKFKKLKLKKK